MNNTSDFSKPQTTDTYVNVTAEVNALVNDLAQGLDPATTNPANAPVNTVRWNSVNGFWEKFSGTTWAALASVYNIVAAQAVKLKTAVTLAISGDVSGSATFDGSQNVTITATLPNVNSNAGTVGSQTTVPVITTNAKGQVTAVSSVAISFPAVPVTSVFGRTGVVVLGSSDVTSALGYTPPQPAGTGASGTWGISISGNAATATSAGSASTAAVANSVPWSGVSGRPTALSQFTNDSMVPANVKAAPVSEALGRYGGGSGNCGDTPNSYTSYLNLNNGSYFDLYYIANNCHNCNCNCCCCC